MKTSMQFLGKEKVPIFGWTDGVQVEDAALQQLKNVANMPFIHKHVAVMPDVHWGMGATVGSVIPAVGAIIPVAVDGSRKVTVRHTRGGATVVVAENTQPTAGKSDE